MNFDSDNPWIHQAGDTQTQRSAAAAASEADFDDDDALIASLGQQLNGFTQAPPEPSDAHPPDEPAAGETRADKDDHAMVHDSAETAFSFYNATEGRGAPRDFAEAPETGASRALFGPEDDEDVDAVMALTDRLDSGRDEPAAAQRALDRDVQRPIAAAEASSHFGTMDELDDLEDDLSALEAARRTLGESSAGPQLRRRRPSLSDETFPSAKRRTIDPPRSTIETVDAGNVRKNYTVRPTDGPYVTCETTKGRMYIPRVFAQRRSSPIARESGSLLSQGISVLLREVQADKLDRQARQKPQEPQIASTHTQTQLWVDKYAPRTFGDLVGDGRTLRQVLGWVRQWDYCVFRTENAFTRLKAGRAPPRPSSATARAAAAPTAAPTELGRPPPGKANDAGALKQDAERRARRAAYELAQYERAAAAHRRQVWELGERAKDAQRRPLRRLVLLAGPPGLGKTTLAHIVARHAGYEPLEINASAERGGDAVRDRLYGALEAADMRTGRPHLVILDEIDGAAGSSSDQSQTLGLVRILVRLAQATKGRTLQRPVICVCNDAYAPVLRPLRLLATTFTFRAAPPRQLAHRLQQICEREHLATDLRAVMALCERADGDVRSCVNALQFFQLQAGPEARLRVEDVGALGLGSKDQRLSLFRVWDAVFRRPAGAAKSAEGRRRVEALVDRSGEHERLMQGCFEAYLRLRSADGFAAAGGAASAARMPDELAVRRSQPRVCQAAEWFSFFDQASRRALHRGQWALAPYLVAPFVALHTLFAGPGAATVTYPRVDYDAHVAQQQRQQIAARLLAGMQPSLRLVWDAQSVALELAYSAVRLVSPRVATVAATDDRKRLRRAARLLVALGVSVSAAPTVSASGAAVILEPAIEQLPLGDSAAEALRDGALRSSACLQVIERDMGRFEARSVPAGRVPLAAGIRANLAQDSTAAPAGVLAPRFDFFGRPVQETTFGIKAASGPPRNCVNYRFNEGFSNAVRKPTPLSSFL